jgi:hypothetical protein
MELVFLSNWFCLTVLIGFFLIYMLSQAPRVIIKNNHQSKNILDDCDSCKPDCIANM